MQDNVQVVSQGYKKHSVMKKNSKAGASILE